MAVFVLMIKVEENREKVIYKFGPDRKCMGIIEYNKITDQFLILEKVNDGKISNEAYERWAAEKIAKLMYREGGVFQDRTVVEK